MLPMLRIPKINWAVQDGILAAMALICANKDQLAAFGVAALTKAADAASSSTMTLSSEGAFRGTASIYQQLSSALQLDACAALPCSRV